MLLMFIIIIILKGNYWADIKNQRKFLEHYVKRMGMNPVLPQTWYNMPRDNISYLKVSFLNSFIIIVLLLLLFY